MQDFDDLSGYQVYACGAPGMVEAAHRDFTTTAQPPGRGILFRRIYCFPPRTQILILSYRARSGNPLLHGIKQIIFCIQGWNETILPARLPDTASH